MNKTISVNIGGRVFNIEEGAYDKLNRYLAAIRSYFEGNDSTDEIISDIELRIAELFLERLTEQKQVVTSADVAHIISVMGKPEEFAGEQEENAGPRSNERAKQGRRVFRDPDNKVVAGVCGGLSAYMGWDPIILRLIFAVAFIFFGSGLLIYIILAIVIPKARTTAEKLQMKGEPVTVENISRKVGESFDDVKEDIKDFGKKNNINEERIKSLGERIGDFIGDVANFLAKVLTNIFAVLVKLIGAVFFFVAIIAIVAIITALFGFHFGLSNWQDGIYMQNELRGIMSSVFDSGVQLNIFLAGVALITLIPLIAMLFAGGRMLFNYKRLPGYTSVILTTLWFVGIFAVASTSVKLYSGFKIESSYTESLPLVQPQGNVLVVGATPANGPEYKFRSSFSDGRFFYRDDVTFPGIDSTDIVYLGRNNFTVAMNQTDSLYKLEIERGSKGSSQKEAISYAKAIETNEINKNDSLFIFPYYALRKGSKIRNQEVHYTLYVPVGKKVRFTENAESILSDVPNVSNTFDRDMVNKTWTMTEKGLECVQCPDNTNETTEY